MKSKRRGNRRLSLALFITAAAVATMWILPGTILGFGVSLANGKSAGVYKVGEPVTFTGQVTIDSGEVSSISAVSLAIAPKTGSTNGGSETIPAVSLPLKEGNHSLTSQLPTEMQTRGSTLEATVTWNTVSAVYGYGYSGGYGYHGTATGANIGYAITWTPAILKVTPPPPPPDITTPTIMFANPGGTVAAEGSMTVEKTFDHPGIPAADSDILGLAYDRYMWVLKVLVDGGGSENDWLIEQDPYSGDVYGVQQLDYSDATDVAWTTQQGDNPKNPSQEGTTWVSYGTSGTVIIRDVSGSANDISGAAATPPLASSALAGLSYPLNQNPRLLHADFQTDTNIGVPSKIFGTNDGATKKTFTVPAGPTSGGYEDVMIDDTQIQDYEAGSWNGPFNAYGVNESTLAKFDTNNGAFLETQVVKVGGEPLPDIVGIASDVDGNVFFATNDPDKIGIYKGQFSGGGGGPPGGPVQAAAITVKPGGNIYMVMDDTANSGNDEVVEVDSAGTEISRWELPGWDFYSLAFLEISSDGGFLYSVARDEYGQNKLWKFNTSGVQQSGFPMQLGGMDDVGGLTANAAGTKLMAVARYQDQLTTINPSNGQFFGKGLQKGPGVTAPQPYGLEGLTVVKGCPICPVLVGVKQTGYYFIDGTTGNITDFKAATTAPPYGITGIAQYGTELLIFTDDSQQVMKGGLPAAVDPEVTTQGEYTATFSSTSSSTVTGTADFSIEKVATLEVAITSPADGAAFTTETITVSGTVNDPTVTSVTLGMDLPSTNLLGPFNFDDGATTPTGWTLTGLWHPANSFKSTARVSSGTYSLAYTDDTKKNFCTGGCEGSGFEVNGTPNSGAATSATFVVGADTKLSFSTWYDTEPGNMFDQKKVQLVEGTTIHTLGQINDMPPMVNNMPQFGASPGTVYTDVYMSPNPQIFLPFGPAMANLTTIELDVPASLIGKTVALRFAFDTIDGWGNGGEGWFVDDVVITGAGAAAGQSAAVTNLTWSGNFTLAAGANTVKATASRSAYAATTASVTITVSMDISKPNIKILTTEDVNGNGTLDTGEDIDGNTTITTLPNVTNVAVQTIFGTYDELNPATLTVKVNDKLVKTIKSGFDADDTTWYAQVNLNDGSNSIVVNLVDSGGLEPDSTDTTNNNLTATVILDTTGPVLTAISPVYPYTATAATPGDPIVWQVTATDRDTSVASVVLGSGSDPMVASTGVPTVLQDQWGTTGNYLFPTIVPASAPPGSLSLTLTATDVAGNQSTTSLTGEVVASMTAWNMCLQRGANLVSTPIQPTNGAIGTLLAQTVSNSHTSTAMALSEAVTSIQYWTGGRTGTGAFQVYAGLPSDDLSSISEGKGYWVFTDADKFKSAAPLPGFTANSYSCMNMKVDGLFLSPGDVPPVFDVKQDWNMVGRHTEEDTTVEKFLKSVTVPTQKWSSLMTYQNSQAFDYENAGGLSMADRVTQTLGAFESRTDMTDDVNRGEGFWLFLLSDGVITP